jgi:phosphoribosylamine--glycine ligase
MKVLVIGNGGREHALCWKIAQSPLVDKIYCAPGNAGISKIAECLDIQATDVFGLRDFAYRNKIDLTVVGPEASLVAGVVDQFNSEGLKIFGPTKEAAQMEGSKSFCKDILKRNGVPTAHHQLLKNFQEAKSFLKKSSFPIVLKADGLAAGKGVAICGDIDSAIEWLESVMENYALGEAGKTVVAEEFLQGEELSVMAITDGYTIVVLEPAQDHKRAFDNDEGPNTGGMGAYSPVPFVPPNLINRIIEEILLPTIHGLKKTGCVYKGVLYAGLMLTQTGPKVIEYNVRFGDPETQPLMMRLKSDIVPLFLGSVNQNLKEVSVPEWHPETAVCVVMASGGYPGKYQTGAIINGLADAESLKNTVVFHAGTAFKDENIITKGGRVLGVTALGKNIKDARENAYAAVKKISFENAFYRNDIGIKALR